MNNDLKSFPLRTDPGGSWISISCRLQPRRIAESHRQSHSAALPLRTEWMEFVQKTKAAKKLCCCRMAHRATKGCASNTKCCCDSATIAKVSSVCGDTPKDVDTSGFTLDPWMPTGLWWRMASLSLSAATARESQTQSCGSTSKFNSGAGRWASQRLDVSSQCCENDVISIRILFEHKTL